MGIVHIAFYPSDWLAGTRGMSAEEAGVYITLIARIYEMAGPIERDDRRLSRLCGCKSKTAFVKVLEYLVSEGKIIEADGFLSNERAQKEIEKTTEKSSKAREAAESRWTRKANKNNAGVNANASPEHMPQRCQPEPEPEPIKKDPKGSKKVERPADVNPDLWSDFLSHRRAQRATLTKTALNGFEREAKKANLSLPQAIQIAIERGWRGFKADWIKPEDRPKPQLVHSNEKVQIAVHDEPELFDKAINWSQQHVAGFQERPGQEFVTVPAHVAENLRKSIRRTA